MNLPIRVIFKTYPIHSNIPFSQEPSIKFLNNLYILSRKALQSAVRFEWLIRASLKVKRDIFEFRHRHVFLYSCHNSRKLPLKVDM